MSKFLSSTKIEESIVVKIRQLIQQENWDAIIMFSTRFLEIYPKNINMHLDRAFAYNSKGEWELSIADYDAVIKLQPDFDGWKQLKKAALFDQARNKELELLKGGKEELAKLSDIVKGLVNNITPSNLKEFIDEAYVRKITFLDFLKKSNTAYYDGKFDQAIIFANKLLPAFCENSFEQDLALFGITLSNSIHCDEKQKWHFAESCNDGLLKPFDTKIMLCKETVYEEVLVLSNNIYHNYSLPDGFASI